jgi:hypothetical protein
MNIHGESLGGIGACGTIGAGFELEAITGSDGMISELNFFTETCLAQELVE